VPRSSFKETPWKNGGGVTHEAIRVPADGALFSWRVSLAQIDKAGPFSDFSGYQRKMLLLQGRGVALKFGEGQRRELREVGDWIEFDGATAVHCDLLGGPCTDLNLIVANALKTAARLERPKGAFAVTSEAGETSLIFSLSAPLQLVDASGRRARLDPWDLAMVAAGTVRLEEVKSAPSATPNAVFIATISQ
jgi:environmental stress-induced protein Ves